MGAGICIPHPTSAQHSARHKVSIQSVEWTLKWQQKVEVVVVVAQEVMWHWVAFLEGSEASCSISELHYPN